MKKNSSLVPFSGIRIVYSVLWWIVLPFVLLRVWWRGRKERGYREHVLERLGLYVGASSPHPKILWVHAVSVGETRAAEPLLVALLDAYPEYAILLTHMTAAGREAGGQLFAGFPRVTQAFLPYDTGWMMKRFLRHFAPRLCVLMETEVWPNLIAQCARFAVPVVLANARLSERSLARAKIFSRVMEQAARTITCIGAQTDADARRLQQIGGHHISVTGSMKFDVTVPSAALAAGAALRTQIGERAVLLCASTRAGEEKLILDAYSAYAANQPDLLLVIVPRHPQRFDEVVALAQAQGFCTLRRSTIQAGPISSQIQVLIGDSMGEMFVYYALCDVAFIGASLLPLGGQNLIEALAVGRPVLIGPHTFNFAHITQQAIAAGVVQQVSDARDVVEAAYLLLHDSARRRDIGQQALHFAQQHRGATRRTLALLAPLIA